MTCSINDSGGTVQLGICSLTLGFLSEPLLETSIEMNIVSRNEYSKNRYKVKRNVLQEEKTSWT